MGKLKVVARILPDGVAVTLAGRKAETILALVEAGPRGISSLDTFRAGWAVRLAAYVHALKSEFGCSIVTLREPHDGGSRGRYFLRSSVEILARSDRPEGEAA